MKSKHHYLLIYLILALGYSFLFFKEGIGINLLIFNGMLIGSILIIRKINWSGTLIMALVMVLLTSCIYIWVHSQLALIANIVAVLLFIGYSLSVKLSLFSSLFQGFYSLTASHIVKLTALLNQNSITEGRKSQTSGQLKYLKLGTYLIPVLITLFFLSLYASANPAFSQVLSGIELAFISWDWVKFMLTGALLIFGAIYTAEVQNLSNWDDSKQNDISRSRKNARSTFHLLGLKYELKTATVLLVMLNSLLAIVIILDFIYIFTNQIPTGLTYSEYVHQGVYTLIASIILAILLLLYFFRGNLNFFKRNSNLTYLSYVWIGLNILLLASIIYKNNLYIAEYGLTYKRIGVYIYLILVLAGLITTFIKVSKHKSVWFLIRKNSWVAYLLLITCSFINWDARITTYNLSSQKGPDLQYLIHLSDNNLPALLTYAAASKTGYATQKELETKKQKFLKKENEQSWKSWNYQDFKLEQLLK